MSCGPPTRRLTRGTDRRCLILARKTPLRGQAPPGAIGRTHVHARGSRSRLLDRPVHIRSRHRQDHDRSLSGRPIPEHEVRRCDEPDGGRRARITPGRAPSTAHADQRAGRAPRQMSASIPQNSISRIRLPRAGRRWASPRDYTIKELANELASVVRRSRTVSVSSASSRTSSSRRSDRSGAARRLASARLHLLGLRFPASIRSAAFVYSMRASISPARGRSLCHRRRWDRHLQRPKRGIRQCHRHPSHRRSGDALRPRSANLVRVGQMVRQGQKIGTVGATGTAGSARSLRSA